MNRLQNRCFAASLALHGALVGIVVFGSAFLNSRQQDENIPVLIFIPAIATDGQFVGGGARPSGTPSPAPPAARSEPPAPAPARAEPTPPAPTPVRPEVRPPVREPEPTPEPVRPVNTREADTVVPRPRPAPVLPESALRPVQRGAKPATNKNLTARPTTRTATRPSDTTESPSASSSTSERSRLLGRLNESINRIGSGTSGSTSVEMPGDGSGGPSYAPYAAIIKATYTERWVKPVDLHDSSAVAVVEIEVAKDGTVLSGRIIERSGNSVMDRSVQEVLNQVRFIKPFPSSWKEERRTFQIKFDLKVKEQLLG